ncbi:MAG: Na/Pi cotransporter family protein [Bdellovibrionales bacterium]|nr:Na/Pi cotransporter family protein [Bdellovibrionales bacterium]
MESKFIYSTYILGLLGMYYGFVGFTKVSSRVFSALLIRMMKNVKDFYPLTVVTGILSTLLFGRLQLTQAYSLGLLYLKESSFKKSVGFVLGCGIATSVYLSIIVVLLHFEWLLAGTVILIFGLLALFIFRSDLYRQHGQRLFYAGVFLLGFAWMNYTHQFLAQDPVVEEVWFFLNQHLLVAFIGSFLLAIFTQSSFLSSVITLSLLHLNIINYESALAMMMGGFVGAPIGPILAYHGVDQRGIAVLGVLSFLRLVITGLSISWIPLLSQASFLITLSPSELLVLEYFFVQVLLFLLYWPFEKRVEFTIKPWITKEPTLFHRYFANLPNINFEVVRVYIMDMAASTKEMMNLVCESFTEKNRDAMIKIDEQYDQVEQKARQINFYLSKMNLEELSYAESQKETHWFQISHAFKNMASFINRNIMEIAAQKKERAFEFYPNAWEHVVACQKMLIENFDRMVENLILEDPESLKSILRNQKQIHSVNEEIKLEYLQELRSDKKLSIEGTAAFLSLLSQLQFLNISISRMAYPTIDRRKQR